MNKALDNNRLGWKNNFDELNEPIKNRAFLDYNSRRSK
jgi:hypothetical protein